MPLPDPSGWAPSSVLNNFGGPDLSAAVNEIRMQQQMYGQEPIPEFSGNAKEYLQLLGATNPDIAQTLAVRAGMDFSGLQQEAAAAGYYEGDPLGGALGRTFQFVGENIKPITLGAFAAPFALGALGGAFGGGAAAAGAGGGGSGAATTFPYTAGGPVTVSPLTTAGSGTATIAGSTTAAGIPAAAGATSGGRFANALPYITGGVNALLGYRAADQAADAESAGLQAGIEESRRQYDTTRNDLMPWLDAGRGALGRLQDPNAFQASPDYEFRRAEGQRDVANSFSARGLGQSGNALRALTEYNSALASGEFGNWWNRQAGLAGVGQTAGTDLGQFGANTASNVGNFLAGQGASRASGVLGKYGAVAQGLNQGVSNWLYRRRVA